MAMFRVASALIWSCDLLGTWTAKPCPLLCWTGSIVIFGLGPAFCLDGARCLDQRSLYGLSDFYVDKAVVVSWHRVLTLDQLEVKGSLLMSFSLESSGLRLSPVFDSGRIWSPRTRCKERRSCVKVATSIPLTRSKSTQSMPRLVNAR